MPIVKKADGTILAVNGIIRADANPCDCCQGCPPCFDNKNDVGLPGSPCDCIPRKWLVVIAGTSIFCDCTIGSTGGPPNAHFKVSAASYDASYCMSGTDTSRSLGFPFILYGNDSPGDNCDGATTIDFGVDATLSVGVAFGAAAVEVTISITGNYNSGGSVLIYSGHVTNQPCEGPWVVPLTNDAGSGCSYDGFNYFVGATPGATATLYPCGPGCT